MSKISPEIWSLLETNLPSGEKLTAKLVVPDISSRVFCALDSEKRRHILVQIKSEDSAYDDRQSRGIQVTTRELNIHGQPPSRYHDLICLDTAGYSGFDLIGSEIISELVKGTKTPSEINHYVLAKWRRFWGQIPQDLLSRNELIGLFAEIRFLTEKLIPEVGPAEAVRRWRGPFGSRHDFEWQGGSVEVKATTSSRGRIFHINGIDQLEPPEHGELFFFGVRLREEGGAELTLPRIIETCRNLLSSDDSLDRFESTLIQAGYSLLHFEEYEKIRFRRHSADLFSRIVFFKITTEQPTDPNNFIIDIQQTAVNSRINTFQHLT
ncbi:MAG: PD-(D/E)XK motif protein, partial [Methanomicrobiales archaeon]|nr:PD-(D/E)XK motif protein [Methanomicrobiales archaeon]